MVKRLACAVVLVGCMPTDVEQTVDSGLVDHETSERRSSPKDDAGPRGSEESGDEEQTADSGVRVVRGPTGPTGPEGPPGPAGPPGEGAVSGCTLTLNPERWTQSDLGEDYLGNVLVSTGVNWSVTETGSFEPTVCSLAQLSNANKLVVSNQICELTIEGFEQAEGGHIFGTFAGRSVITAVDDPGEQGFVEVTGAFQVQL
jgi:hypothetical protein